MVTVIIPVVLIVVGALMYAFAANEKIKEMGRLTFAAGVFGLSLRAAGPLHF